MQYPLVEVSHSGSEHVGYMSWADFSRRFSVNLTSEFVHQIDPKLLYKEMKNVPDLRFSAEQLLTIIQQKDEFFEP